MLKETKLLKLIDDNDLKKNAYYKNEIAELLGVSLNEVKKWQRENPELFDNIVADSDGKIKKWSAMKKSTLIQFAQKKQSYVPRKMFAKEVILFRSRSNDSKKFSEWLEEYDVLEQLKGSNYLLLVENIDEEHLTMRTTQHLLELLVEQEVSRLITNDIVYASKFLENAQLNKSATEVLEKLTINDSRESTCLLELP